MLQNHLTVAALMPAPAEIAAEIVDSLELALEKFRLIAAKLAT